MKSDVGTAVRARTLVFMWQRSRSRSWLFMGSAEREGARRGAPANPTQGPAAGAAAKVDALPHVLLALAAIVVASRILGFFFRKIRQPRVIGEVIAGILIGPTFLGRVAPDFQAYLLPSEAAPILGSWRRWG